MAANLAIFQPEVFACAIARTGGGLRTGSLRTGNVWTLLSFIDLCP